MGLRAKLTISLLLLFSLLGVFSLSVLRHNLLASYEAIERDASVRGLRQVLDALDDQLTQLDQVLRGWSNWSELQAHLRGPRTADFARRNLNPNGLSASALDWLVVVDERGRALHQVVSSTTLVDTQALAQLRIDQPPLARWLARPAAGSPPDCGVLRLPSRLLMLCRRPVRDTEGLGEFVGSVVVGRYLDASLQAAMARVTNLAFTLVLVDPATPPAAGPAGPTNAAAPLLRSRLGEATVVREEAEQSLTLRWPVRDVAAQVVAELRVQFPRDIVQRGRDALDQTFAVLMLLGLLVALGMLVVVDRLVVARLKRLHARIQHIEATRQLDLRVPAEGHDEIAALGRHANDMLALVRQQMRRLENLTLTDSLTDLANRRHFDQALAAALSRHHRTGRQLALLLLDVDHFKTYNDRYGHAAGDEALRAVAGCIRAAASRPGDLAARTGGEEFAVLLDDPGPQGAFLCAERARQRLRELGLVHADNAAGVLTLSAGVALVRPGDTAQTVYERADTALYEAKSGGRDQVRQVG